MGAGPRKDEESDFQGRIWKSENEETLDWLDILDQYAAFVAEKE